MTQWFWEFHSVFSGWLLGVIALTGGGGVYWLIRRRPVSVVGIVLRVLAAILLFLEISLLTLVERQVPKVGVCVVLDDSRSMTLPAENSVEKNGVSRLESALRRQEELVTELEKTGVLVQTVKLSEVGGDLLASPLASALKTVFRTDFWGSARPVKLAGTVLMTDGICTENGRAENFLPKEGKGTVFPVIFGEKWAIPQVYAVGNAPRLAILCGEETSLNFRVFGTGLIAPTEPETRALRHVRFRLITENKEVLAETDGIFSGTESVLEIRFPWVPDVAGTQKLRLECDFPEVKGRFSLTFPAEITVKVADRVRRVLLVTAGPDWEFRYLRNLLVREPSIQVETWSPPDCALTLDPAQDAVQRVDFPTEEELQDFDVVILNSISPADLGPENEAILNRVWTKTESRTDSEIDTESRRRGLILIAGRNFCPEKWERTVLAELFPFSFQGMNWVTTENQESRQDRAVALTLSGASVVGFDETDSKSRLNVYSFWKLGNLLSGSEIVMETTPESGAEKQAERMPIVIRGRNSAVTTLFHGTDNFWRWRKKSEEPYRAYWIQSIHTLCQVENGERTELTENLTSETSLKTLEIRDAGERDTGRIPGQELELLQTAADWETMEKWAKLTGGTVLDPQTMSATEMAEEIVLTLRAQEETQEETQTLEIRHPIWRHPAIWLTICGLFFWFWVEERRGIVFPPSIRKRAG